MYGNWRMTGSARWSRSTTLPVTHTIRRQPRPPPNRRWHDLSLSRRPDAGGLTTLGERTPSRMQPLSRDRTGPDQARERRSEARVSGRAQRRIAEEKAARRKRLMIVGGAIAAALIV